MTKYKQIALIWPMLDTMRAAGGTLSRRLRTNARYTRAPCVRLSSYYIILSSYSCTPCGFQKIPHSQTNTHASHRIFSVCASILRGSGAEPHALSCLYAPDRSALRCKPSMHLATETDAACRSGLVSGIAAEPIHASLIGCAWMPDCVNMNAVLLIETFHIAHTQALCRACTQCYVTFARGAAHAACEQAARALAGEQAADSAWERAARAGVELPRRRRGLHRADAPLGCAQHPQEVTKCLNYMKATKGCIYMKVMKSLAETEEVSGRIGEMSAASGKEMSAKALPNIAMHYCELTEISVRQLMSSSGSLQQTAENDKKLSLLPLLLLQLLLLLLLSASLLVTLHISGLILIMAGTLISRLAR
eukprot:2265055-Pleurochrysis_carterae.AAC.2